MCQSNFKAIRQFKVPISWLTIRRPFGYWEHEKEPWLPDISVGPLAMSAMPSVDYYIFIEKTWQALNITTVGLYYVQMWKWIVMIFLCDIFSGARGMLKSLRNHRQSQQPTGRNGGLSGADAEKKNSLSWSLNRLQLSLYQQAGWTRSKYNYWRRKGLTER